MKRLLLAVAAVAIAVNAASPGSNSTGRFDSKLSPEQKIQQAISRLTFGARPGDFEGVRKLGVESGSKCNSIPSASPKLPTSK